MIPCCSYRNSKLCKQMKEPINDLCNEKPLRFNALEDDFIKSTIGYYIVAENCSQNVYEQPFH